MKKRYKVSQYNVKTGELRHSSVYRFKFAALFMAWAVEGRAAFESDTHYYSRIEVIER